MSKLDQDHIEKVANLISQDSPIKNNIFMSLTQKNLLIKSIISLKNAIDKKAIDKKAIDKTIKSLLVLIKIASLCKLSDDNVSDVVVDLLKTIDPMEMVYNKRYNTLEVVPQQYVQQIKVFLPDMYSQWVDVYYLLDQMVGYKFEDGTSWSVGAQIKV